MISHLLLTALLAGSFDAGIGIGGAAPFGTLEFNQSSGVSGSIDLGYSTGPSRLELAGTYLSLPGTQQPDYRLTNYQVSLTYHYALVNRPDWKLRAGAGVDLNDLSRQVGTAAEYGSVIGPTLAFTFVRSFGHPLFKVRLFGSELLEFTPSGNGSNLTPATLVGFEIGAGYEF